MLNHQPPTESAYLQFGQNHQPALDAGDYTLTVEQMLTDGANNTATYSRKLLFSVLGERFSLPAPLVHSVFPPANGLGEYNNVLPHIVLQRSTLPWERDAQPDNETAPWLALLVFSPDELTVMPAATNVTDSPTARLEAQIGYSLEVNDLLAGGLTKKPQFAAAQTAWTGLKLETGQTKTDRVSVIFVPKKTILPLLPTLDDLTKLAHVRRGTNERSQLVEDERPVIISKRLPQKGGESIVHLVSLENRYGADGRFQFNGAGDDDPIPFISLYTWRFTSLSPKHTFRGLLLHLNQVPIFHVPDSTDLDLDFARQSGIPAKLRMEFAQAGYPLSEGSATTMTDRADREIVLKDYHWLIGNSGAVYDQAGYVQFQLDGLPTTADKAKPEAIIAAIRSRVSNLPSTATVTPLQVRHWWVTDQITNRRYFVRHSAGAVEALQLELDHAPVLRLPDTGHELANRFLHQGYVPLPHYPRQGGKTVSWYRGPLTTSEKKAVTLNRNLFDVNTPDELLLYHTDVGTFDLTYAAAWELGRLLALQSKRFSVGLHQWRRTHARATGQAELHQAHLHLPLSGTADAALTAEFPPVLQAWLAQLWTLEGIPYNYLVPDERLLPPESLRFFSLDPDWMGCLVHGAFSIGANAGTNHWSGESEQHPVTANLTADKPVDGFLLKSEVVSGYPGMDIEVYETANSTTPLPILRRQLAPDTILCLYEGAARQVRFHLKPDVLHFGFDETETSLVKYLNGADAMQSETSTVVEVDAASRVVNIATLFDAAQTYWYTNPRAESAFKEFGSGHFALALLEGVAQVNYNRKES